MKYSREELCRKYKNDRSKLYKERSKLLKIQKAGGLSEKKYQAIDKKIKRVSDKIDVSRVKIFKCGKKFQKLRDARKKNVRLKQRLGIKLKELTAMGASETDKNKVRTKIGEVAVEIRNMDALMGKDIIVEKGKVEVISDAYHEVFRENIPVWQLAEEASPHIESNRYDLVYIDGEEFNIKTQRADIIFAIDEYIDKIHLSQASKKTATPMVWLILNEGNRTISIQQDI